MNRWADMFDRVNAIRDKFSDLSPAELQSLIDEATRVVREEMIREGRFALPSPSNP